ncbi:hydroxymethylglutaryl-CoA lyase [Psychrobacillus insolitus]|uniref:Hydroxymethylglutaryl-CoA lyase n=1 Tax=Psychrobacillus insolitus TaxID=1461 RepID=A0A2W7MED9_9BACI|nr:hydroxymethylglutaryl-CoA lyase [Psychrobacillus insolitus]PZX02355.1 hydroxymethylglutaryl-CoA lyase [Psychrobacillus insolitus]
MVNKQAVILTEVCPRDGFQSISEWIPTETKIDITNRLIDCGYKQIEVTSFVHPKAIPQLKDADELLKQVKRVKGVKFRALVPNVRGLERAIAVGVDKAKLMLSASDSHSLSNANCTTEEALQNFEPLIVRAKQSDIAISGSISVAFGCPYEGDIPVERLAMICERYRSFGITEVSLADTTGMANPTKIKRNVRALRELFPEITFSLHLHNTRGMAFANAVAGYEEGIIHFDSSAGGLGGCPYAPGASGNIASEDLIHGFGEMGIETNLSLDQVLEAAKYIQQLLPQAVDSFLLKAGKCSDLSASPKGQKKVEV